MKQYMCMHKVITSTLYTFIIIINIIKLFLNPPLVPGAGIFYVEKFAITRKKINILNLNVKKAMKPLWSFLSFISRWIIQFLIV